ncbi:MAG: GAF domain-containing protein, partial [Planctomycetaceae bacterium]|nr:GAF domain-containing protein [Planctomycetaceae bacterium]
GVVRRIHQRLEEAIRQESEAESKTFREVPERLFRIHKSTVERNDRRCEQVVRDLLGRLCEKYQVRHGWLFTPETPMILRAQFAYRSRLLEQRLRIDQRGIISHVYQSQRAYVAEDTNRDPLYVQFLESTRSEIAAAVVVPGPGHQRRVLGVLNLESDEVGWFTPAMREEFEVDVQEFALPLFLMDSVDDRDVTQWPPCSGPQGWRTESMLKSLCDEFVQYLSEHRKCGSLSATVWFADWRQEVLWALTTNGYDYEFLTQALPMESFTGGIAATDRGFVKQTTPEDEPTFVEKEKARSLGLQRITATPIFTPRGGCRAWGSLNLYQFEIAEPERLPEPATVAAFAHFLASVRERFEELRDQAACIHLDSKMRVSRHLSPCNRGPGALLPVLKDLLCEFLAADGCSIFMADEAEEALNVVTSTGIRDERIELHEGRWVACRAGSDDLPLKDSGRESVLSFLYWHPGVALTINAPEEFRRSCESLPEAVSPQCFGGGEREHLTPDSAVRRFLGIGIRLDERTRIVVRLVRSTNSPRFNDGDERLLERLAAFCLQQEFWCRMTEHRQAETPRRRKMSRESGTESESSLPCSEITRSH